MLPAERHRLILERLARRGAASVGELTIALGVSRETVRRDLARLAALGALRPTRGGALSLGPREAHESERRTANLGAKRAIARHAVRMVADGTVVLLDSGTTTRCVAEALTAKRELTVLTNDLQIALTLGRRNGNRVLLLGGALLAHEDATLGLDTLAMLSRYRAEIAFIGAGGLSADGDLTDFTREGAELRARMLAAARRAVVVADHSKFARATPVRVVGFGRGAALLVDRPPPAQLRGALRRRGVRLIVANDRRS